MIPGDETAGAEIVLKAHVAAPLVLFDIEPVISGWVAISDRRGSVKALI
jgi:hypothetical protein